MTFCQVYADVGPWWPEGFPRHRRRGRGDDIMGADAPMHPHKLCSFDTQGTHGASQGLS